VIVDIRSPYDRKRDGIVPGSFHIPVTKLEWRIDIECEWRNHLIGGLETRIILLCDQGFSSALAACRLREIGLNQATDIIDGFKAWCDAGLPTADAPTWRSPKRLEGQWAIDWGPDYKIRKT
jgi:rhodanese-related sulfurtransferase